MVYTVKYGKNTKYIDVTKIIMSAIAKNQQIISLCNNLFGDPYPLVFKEIIIDFSDGRRQIFPENSVVTWFSSHQLMNNNDHSVLTFHIMSNHPLMLVTAMFDDNDCVEHNLKLLHIDIPKFIFMSEQMVQHYNNISSIYNTIVVYRKETLMIMDKFDLLTKAADLCSTPKQYIWTNFDIFKHSGQNYKQLIHDLYQIEYQQQSPLRITTHHDSRPTHFNEKFFGSQKNTIIRIYSLMKTLQINQTDILHAIYNKYPDLFDVYTPFNEEYPLTGYKNDLIFCVSPIPMDGLGNIMKAFITALSISDNTCISTKPVGLYTDFRSIVHEKYIFDEQKHKITYYYIQDHFLS